jgi:Ras GTPase-activating-like protein IQGAP2/3
VQIAKMLQNLANKPSYSKEAYMATLNPFVENNKARINQFLNSLCEVGDFYDTLEVPSSPCHQTNAHPTPQMDQYMALSKKDMMIHITLNELYNTHSLILQHIEALVRFSPFSFGVASLIVF